MKYSVLLFALPLALAQLPPVPGSGNCEEPCIAIRNPVSGFLFSCCAAREEDMEACEPFNAACTLGDKEGCCCNGNCEEPDEDNGGCPDGCIPNNPSNGCEHACCGVGIPNDDGTRVSLPFLTGEFEGAG
ncbi:hypothetical protein ACRE_081710 [Hapsidospora chrysogenum ATCC 11550]|uniref:Uncharacterized protein n=1 Tax=Hapsidospora chrysogenum (strain ATCC 11550 / CBS 779.69 / DSM 880 / IAM 14645 / JCM 23072 / IMI 49137) TaxID=857340 RepID=A0A086SVJ7_HAPC1|nr:hypothetical protein ACRE_081710 [Hapsidospora chrysogenum ATCC 11550]